MRVREIDVARLRELAREKIQVGKRVKICAGDSLMNDDPEILVGLSEGELEALADSVLTLSAQTRLNELLGHNSQRQLESQEMIELDHLLERVDHLTILKTRARYTLQYQKAGASRV
jgi:hypothetical protein